MRCQLRYAVLTILTKTISQAFLMIENEYDYTTQRLFTTFYDLRLSR
jgi:hypothetical protein